MNPTGYFRFELWLLQAEEQSLNAVMLLRCMEKPQKSTMKKEKTRVEQRLNGIWLRHKSSRYDYQSNRNAGVQISICEICTLFFRLTPIFDGLRKKCAVYASIMPPH